MIVCQVLHDGYEYYDILLYVAAGTLGVTQQRLTVT